MSAELRERLGTSQFVRFVTFRSQQAADLARRASESAARLAQLKPGYDLVFREIDQRGLRPRNVPTRVNTVERVNWLPRRSTHVESLDRLRSRASARVGEVYSITRRTAGTRVSGPTSNWRIRPRTWVEYYQVKAIEDRPAPFTPEQLEIEIEKRLLANPTIVGYRAARIQNDILQSRFNAYKVLG